VGLVLALPVPRPRRQEHLADPQRPLVHHCGPSCSSLSIGHDTHRRTTHTTHDAHA
jgi:hypothetical protein